MDSQVKHYNDSVVLKFTVMTVVWGIVGMTVGLLIAAQLAWPQLNFDIPWLTYSRLRPLHTKADGLIGFHPTHARTASKAKPSLWRDFRLSAP